MPEIALPYIPPAPYGTDVLSPGQLRDGAISIGESRMPHAGYPQLRVGGEHGRLFMTPEQAMEATGFEEVYMRSDGTALKIDRIVLPGGHDTNSRTREAFLADSANVENLIYPPIPDIVTGSDASVDDIDPPAFQRFLDSGFTVFDQHNRPLPGSFDRVVQLLGLRTRGRSGEPLGMPVGNGTFASPGSHPAADVFPLMPIAPGSDELAVLVYGRPPTAQSVGVWAPPGGFGSKADIVDEKYSSWQSAVRLCAQKTGVNVSEYAHVLTHTEFALSSPTTANAGLISESHLAIVPYTEEFAARALHEVPTGEAIVGVQWLAVNALLAANSKLRRWATIDQRHDNPQPNQIFWSTHMRGLVASINMYRSLMQ